MASAVQERWIISEIAIRHDFENSVGEEREGKQGKSRKSYPGFLIYDFQPTGGNDQPDSQFVFALSPSSMFKALKNRKMDEDEHVSGTIRQIIQNMYKLIFTNNQWLRIKSCLV